MKHPLHIVILSLSTLLIVLMPYIPHHHHDGAECMAKELCVQDEQYNDEHTAHHHDESSHDPQSCIKHIRALKASQPSLDTRRIIPILPLLALLTSDIFIQTAILLESEAPHGCDHHYLSHLVDTSHALRAPPYIVID